MASASASELQRAEELLEQVRSWSEEEIEELPFFYKRKAREYRQLPQNGEE